MSRRVVMVLVLILAVVTAASPAPDAVVAKKRGNAAAGQITVCASGCQYKTLQDAVNAARSGDTILIKSGRPLVGPTTIDSKNLTLNGDGQAQSILDGGGKARVLTITNANVTVQDVTIRNGNASEGGGISVQLGGSGGSLTLINSVVSGNQAGNGGAIVNRGSNLTIRNSDLLNNHASGDGGAVYNFNRFGSVTVQGSEVKGNQASGCGGGLWTGSESISLVNTDVNDNTAGTHGGGFCAGGSAQAILSKGSTVERNTPDDCFPANACVKASSLP
jgi:hypothetical protein